MKFFLVVLYLPLSLFAFAPSTVTPYPVVGYKKVPFVDDQKNDRELLIWYPVDPEVTGMPSDNPWDLFNIARDIPIEKTTGTRPVVVISHGYTGSPHQLSWLIRGLVHKGYIVLGIQHRDLVNGKAHLNHWQRPMDITSIITQFASLPLAQSADMQRIGIAGFSLGGTTSIWIAGGRATKLETIVPNSDYASPEDFSKVSEALPTLNREMMKKDWRDSRIKAAFIMAPAWSWLFDEENLQKISIPTYIIAGSVDGVLVTRNNAGFFARNIPKALYQEISGQAGHYIFISTVNNSMRKKIDPQNQLNFLFEDNVSIDRTWIQFQVVEEAVGFFNSALG